MSSVGGEFKKEFVFQIKKNNKMGQTRKWNFLFMKKFYSPPKSIFKQFIHSSKSIVLSEFLSQFFKKCFAHDAGLTTSTVKRCSPTSSSFDNLPLKSRSNLLNLHTNILRSNVSLTSSPEKIVIFN